jgi:hypothetical protein
MITPASTLLPQMGAVRRHLIKLGWEEKISKDAKLKRYTLQEGNHEIHIFLSVDASEEIARSEMKMALQTLEQVYGSSQANVLRATAAFLYDQIKAVIPDDYVQNDTIDLKTASSFIHDMRGFLASSATVEDTGDRKVTRNPKASLDYANTCRFGHTFKGSFGFTIDSPLIQNDEPTMPLPGMPEPEPPQGRKVLQRINRSFRDLAKAKQSQSLVPLIEENSSISVKMCDDLVTMLQSASLSKIMFSFDFSPEWKDDLSSDQTFDLGVGDINFLQDASTKLKGTIQPKLTTIFGYVDKLKASQKHGDIFNDAARRQITVYWDSPDHGRVGITLQLAPEEYKEALKAHSETKPYFAAGVLHKNGNSWVLLDITKVGIVDLPN